MLHESLAGLLLVRDVPASQAVPTNREFTERPVGYQAPAPVDDQCLTPRQRSSDGHGGRLMGVCRGDLVDQDADRRLGGPIAVDDAAGTTRRRDLFDDAPAERLAPDEQHFPRRRCGVRVSQKSGQMGRGELRDLGIGTAAGGVGEGQSGPGRSATRARATCPRTPAPGR